MIDGPDRWTRRLGWVCGLLGLGLLVARVVQAPVEIYGDSGAGWIEHMARVQAILDIQRTGALWPWDVVRSADGLYPPGLHLLTCPLAALGAHSTTAAVLTGIGWLGLLAGAVAVLAHHARGPVSAWAAVVVTLGMPALHGVATRYYYDLPMVTAIWWGAAVLVVVRSPVRAGVGAGLLLGLACLIKWSAIPLGLPIILAAAVHRRCWRTGLVVAGTSACALGALASLDLPSWGAMGSATFQPPPGVVLRGDLATLAAGGPVGQAIAVLVSSFQSGVLVDRIGFYAARLVHAGLSPALAVVWGVWWVPWARAKGPGLLAGMVSAVPVMGFVVVLLPPLDERFLLSLLPGLALAAGWGRASLATAVRAWTDRMVVVVALVVAADFHLPPRGATLPSWLRAESSVDRRGWGRRDEGPPVREALRTALWSTLNTCPWRAISGTDLLIDPTGDLNWWGHQTRLAALRGDPSWSWTVGDEGELWLRPAPPSAWASPSDPPARYTLVAEVRDPDGGAGIEIWQAPGLSPCPALP